MTPISIVCWKWRPSPGYRSHYPPETVNILKRMIDRHYHQAHRFLCVTDDATGIDPSVEIVPLFNDFADIPSPHGGKNPSCYRRLRAYAPDIGDTFGPRFVMLDLDTVITGDVTPLFDRPEDFVIWGDTNPKTHYNGSLVLMTAGARRQVWEQFDPRTSPKKSMQAGCFGSDQGWISYCLGPGEAKWSKADGVYSYRNDLHPTRSLPSNAKLVSFHGRFDPWSDWCQRLPWVQEAWR